MGRFRRTPDELTIVAAVAIVVVVVIGYMIYDGQDVLGLTVADVNKLAMLIPPAVAVLFGGYAISQAEGNRIYTFAAVACFGFAVAYTILSLNNQAILIPDLVMTVEDLIVLLIFIFVSLGGLLMWRSNR